ncbi:MULTISPECIES: phosphonate C-P lyase system protein PhnH [unclassified Rhizobium]|uniref:phosphonate C-P lyase system protein PhnH n=1 Tax=unclassified Rhizobium TaxID=2613769 RepID=UPI001621C91E|nr:MULTISPECIES: phosphonate C-P lyase system protein PhnH [unclassified Rhizobium]MBB3290817.1 alpha-D-ribose 1-methylphosphonate 5-triphosphate synthase subunit PhnH [Rhizobium sp. BK252]MBB3405597.1 alpha-D-ribose 1-methylphosphonate 5-triphosphate synthase subunit PhnH [Rhizobium sp. BK289]MBB3418113.1 alpha-D-ribose 1-methylphosphonate 5-triphosphate synthase subunit PhnH [Rhizobium sp. BK284]MBB3485992.1 alpha-D-ribose 1-methylphosphonate 5-triphosphate synthase subunit PhnH [Rhizobium sp
MSLSSTPTFGNEALTGGFIDPVFDAQSVFKKAMDAMARPGTLQTVEADVAPPAPLGVAAGAIGLTLCDHDTSVWLSNSLARSSLPEWLGFHTGAPVISDRLEAQFAFIEAGMALSSFSQFGIGTQEYPDRSTTIVLEVQSLEGGKELALSGPGIKDVTMIGPVGLPDALLRIWNDNRALFPRGVDLILTADRQFLCLPRTTKITATEL